MFDDPNLVSAAGLIPLLALADRAGLRRLVEEHLSVPTDKGANAGLKVASLVAGMVAGADSIDDMALLRHGGMGRVFAKAYARSTLGSFLRAFAFGHVRQLDAVAARFLLALATLVALVGAAPRLPPAGDTGGYAFVDVDDTIIEVHRHAKHGAGFGYTRVRGLNELLATRDHQWLCTTGRGATTAQGRLRLAPRRETLGRRRRETSPPPARPRPRDPGPDGLGLLRPRRGPRALTGGAHVSVTVRATRPVKAAIAGVDEHAWTTIKYPDAILDEATGTWISKAEVAEVPFTAFASQRPADRVHGRLVVRRIPDVHADNKHAAGQDTLFDTWRFHAFFTTVPADALDTVATDRTHRAHPIIEQVHADLKNSALTHLPSGPFAANSAWLVLAVIAFNLTRAATTLTAVPELAEATTATARRNLIQVPARVASSARRITLHLPAAWPWNHAWTRLLVVLRLSSQRPQVVISHQQSIWHLCRSEGL